MLVFILYAVLVNDMRTTGLVMDTLTGDPKGSEQQFVHPSIQDFLAMRGLLAEDDGNIKNVLKQLFSSQRFDTALLFLYGLAFDERIVSSSVSLGLGQMKKTREALVGMISVGISYIYLTWYALSLR